jgi:Tfp pilus assembly ATPase PilU
LIRESLDETHFERFLHTREANYAIQRGSLGRFRVSAFWQQDMPGMVLRRIETRIPTFDELVLPHPAGGRHGQARAGASSAPLAPASPPPRRP